MFRDLMDDIDNYSTVPDTFLDVPFVPTDDEAVQVMLKLGRVGPKDVLYDLGSGDGRIVIAAARDRDARGVGIDIDPVQIADAMEEAGWAGVERLVDFIEDDIFTADFSEATVVTLYLLESVNLQLRPRLLSQLRPGSRVVSHAFDMGNWMADDWVKMSGTTIYRWIVPAQVAGVWEWMRADGKTYRVALQQEFQNVTGSAWLDDKDAYLESVTLTGGRLELKLAEGENSSIDSFIMTFEDNKTPPTVVSAPPDTGPDTGRLRR